MKLNTFIQSIMLSAIITGVFVSGYTLIEPSFVGAATDSTVVSLTVSSGITITSPTDVTMSPDITASNNTSTGSATWTVVTNDNAGYALAVKSSTSPALQGSSTDFDDYTEAVSGTPDSWSVDSGTYQFGYSAFGTDVSSATWGSGSNCGSGNPSASGLKYLGFETSDKTIASRAAVTSLTGVGTTLCLGSGQSGIYAPTDTYQATIIATATVQ